MSQGPLPLSLRSTLCDSELVSVRNWMISDVLPPARRRFLSTVSHWTPQDGSGYTHLAIVC